MDKKEYIERSAVKELIKNYGHNAIENGYKELDPVDDIVALVESVDDIPVADVVEARHGAWIEHYSFGAWHYDCPFCDDGFGTSGRETTPPNFCSNCGAKLTGAKMKGE